MAKKKSHLTLKLGPIKQREIFNNVLLRRYLNESGKEYFTSDDEKEGIIEQLDDIWESEFKNRTDEFAGLSANELEDIFDSVDIAYDDTLDDEVLDDIERIQKAATAVIMNIPMHESGFDTKKIRYDLKDPLVKLNELEQIRIRWAYDVASRVARYAYEEDKEIRKYLRKEIHGLLSAYLPKQKIIPVRDLMIDEYKNSLLYL